MNNGQILEILNDWNFWKKNPETGIKRNEYLKKLKSLAQTEQIISIIGPRRAGKSTLMFQYIKELLNSGIEHKNTLYVNFEDPRFLGEISINLLQNIYDAYLEYLAPDKKPFIFLDEIQNIPSWEKFVRSIHERKEANIFISGSSSKLLSSEFGSVLTGRHLSLTLYPLNFKEFLVFKNLKINAKLDIINEKNKIKKFLAEYLEFGGLPKVVLTENEKKEILARYFEDIISRDIVERFKIKKVDKLKALAKYYFTNISSLISFNRIRQFIGMPINTVERFSLYFTYPYFLFFVKKFSYSLKEQEVNPRKVYSIDCGLRNAVSFKTGEDTGKLYENAVFLELLRSGYEIYYWKDKKECDFIIKKENDLEAIQVSCDLSNPETKKREVLGLICAMEKFNIKNGIIITDNYEYEEIIKNKKIEFIPLWKWLTIPLGTDTK